MRFFITLLSLFLPFFKTMIVSMKCVLNRVRSPCTSGHLVLSISLDWNRPNWLTNKRLPQVWTLRRSTSTRFVIGRNLEDWCWVLVEVTSALWILHKCCMYREAYALMWGPDALQVCVAIDWPLRLQDCLFLSKLPACFLWWQPQPWRELRSSEHKTGVTWENVGVWVFDL